MKKTAPMDSLPNNKELDCSLLTFDPEFDLRLIIYNMLQKKGNTLDYYDSRQHICRMIHINKHKCRDLLISMRKAGLIRFSKNKIILREEEIIR